MGKLENMVREVIIFEKNNNLIGKGKLIINPLESIKSVREFSISDLLNVLNLVSDPTRVDQDTLHVHGIQYFDFNGELSGLPYEGIYGISPSNILMVCDANPEIYKGNEDKRIDTKRYDLKDESIIFRSINPDFTLEGKTTYFDFKRKIEDEYDKQYHQRFINVKNTSIVSIHFIQSLLKRIAGYDLIPPHHTSSDIQRYNFFAVNQEALEIIK
jgi:hypothetical protein